MTGSNDRYNLYRFVEAQEPDMSQVKEELRAGKKCTHWMWYVFPQVTGLGKSPAAERYAIKSRDEAEAYLAHDILVETQNRLELGLHSPQQSSS
jgi:uncharacterized protein (DUF1810 family)